MRSYKVGTRDSLLATTQTLILLDQLKAKTGLDFEMVTMKTSGDLDTSKPLWQLDGKNFFTKELDSSLLDGEIDLMVSSYKDIGSSRPDGIVKGAVTKRLFSQDILLIKKETVKRLSKLETLNVGTSSPRRICNVTKKLSEYLPVSDIKVECSMLRGNINTRIQKLRDDKYDAIILALAGVERLALRDDSKEVLKGLLDGLTFMVMPERVFPSAPSQGALLVECLESADLELINALKTVHHEDTAREIEVEREHFNSFGGGCHLAVGIYARALADGMLTVLKGEHDGHVVDQVFFESNRSISPVGKSAFVGMKLSEDTPDFLGDKLVLKDRVENLEHGSEHVFLTSAYGVENLNIENPPPVLWVSGDRTFKKSCQEGLWVNGSSDAMGEEVLSELLSSEALKLMGTDLPLRVFTSSIAQSKLGETITCYDKKVVDPGVEYAEQLRDINVFYWTSYSQFEDFCSRFDFIKDESNIHCCGLGKTYRDLVGAGINALPFDSIEKFKTWFRGSNS